jgi:hypothetical protein
MPGVAHPRREVAVEAAAEASEEMEGVEPP